MENQTGSCENKNTSDFSSPSVSRMQKQKAVATMKDDTNNSQRAKIQKITESSSFHTPNHNQPRPLSQNRNTPQINPIQMEIEDSSADFKQLTEIPTLYESSLIKILSISDENTQLAEMENQFVQANKEIKKLRHIYEEIKQRNEKLQKNIESEDKIRSELIEKQEMSDRRLVVIQEQTANLSNTLSGLQENRDEINEMYNVVLVQAQKMKNMEEQFDHHISGEEQELTHRIMLEEKYVSFYKMKCEQLEHEFNQKTHILSETDDKLGELEKIIREDKQLHDENMKKNVSYLNEIEGKINVVQGEKSTLLMVRDEGSKKHEELVLKLKTLQSSMEEREKNKESLKSNVQKLQEEQTNLKTKIQELQEKNSTILSEKDSEIANYKKQIQDSSAEYEETLNRENEVNSNIEKLSDTLAEVTQINKELKEAVMKKDDEIKSLAEAMIEASKKNNELSAESEILDKELIAKRKLLSQVEAEFDNSGIEEDEAREKESELRMRLATAKEKLKNKIDDIVELHKENNGRELEVSEVLIKLQQIIGEKHQKIIEVRKIREDLESKKDQMESENNRKLQQLTYSSMQCQKAGHEKQNKELTLKLDILNQEHSAQKLKHKQDIMKLTEQDKKVEEQGEAQLNEMKSKIKKIEKLISASKEQQKKLKITLKDVQTHNDQTKSADVEEPLNSSKLMGTIFTKHMSVPTSSTPEHTPPQQSQGARFEFESFSDMSSINGSNIFEESERAYAEYLETNKTDNAKLNKKDRTD